MLKSHMASGHCTRQQNIEHFHHRRGSSGQRWILVSNNDEDLWLRGSCIGGKDNLKKQKRAPFM